MFKKVLTLLIVFSVAITPTLASAATISNEQENEVSPEQIKAMAKELEYIFTELAVKDESTGDYVINEEALENSSFSELEKEGFVNFINYMNNRDAISIQSNAFERCWQDAVGIGGAILDEFLSYVENEQWIAAAGILAVAGIAVHPATIFVFALTCGPSPAG